MNGEQVRARSAIEALRSGVPSRHAVEQLGTTQDRVREEFETRLRALGDGQGVEPLVIAANFGAGKSHLLNYLSVLAAAEGFVQAFVVVSPEMPLGNAHLVLKAVAEAAEAPGRTGRALRALATDLHTNSTRFAELRVWARDAGLDERFPAMLHLYEEMWRDEELRTRIQSDIEGNPINLTLLRQNLKELGQAAGYALKGKKNALLAHDRIRMLARFYRACTGKGLVVLFDEVERMALFPTKQRLAAWEELGWWRETAMCDGAAILPVFAVAAGELGIERDEPRFRAHTLGLDSEDRDRLGLAGIEMLQDLLRLASPTPDQQEQIKYRVKAIYEQAYGVRAPDIDAIRRDGTTIRAEVRRWLTLWDLQRYYPEYSADVVAGDIVSDTAEIDESVFAGDEDSSEA